MASRADVFLPRGVERATLAALLDSCDCSRLVGRRDYAILKVLCRLGLRSAEVAALRLDDVNWRAGLVVVRGKGKAVDMLPLPVDVGDAVASYLSWESLHRKTRTVFVRVRAPHGPLASSAISMVVYRACRRAGVAEIGAHRLRHSLATEMLNDGASLSEVAQALRHRSIRSTARYARVDRLSLRQVAAPWPTVRDRRPRPPRSSHLGSVARPWPGSEA
jgi:site-specific recombinase XerD